MHCLSVPLRLPSVRDCSTGGTAASPWKSAETRKLCDPAVPGGRGEEKGEITLRREQREREGPELWKLGRETNLRLSFKRRSLTVS